MTTTKNDPAAKPKSRPLLRVITSALLAALVIYGVWFRASFRSSPKTRQTTAQQHLKTLQPFSESTAFAWVPHYPGAVTEDISSSVNHDRVSRGFHFRVTIPDHPVGKAPPPDVAAVRTYYETQLRAAGFTVVMKVVPKNETANGTKSAPASDGILHAESSDGKRILELTLATDSAGLQGNVAAVEK
jgi:hypothetical protein